MKKSRILMLLLALTIACSCSKETLEQEKQPAEYSFVKLEFLNTAFSNQKEVVLAQSRSIKNFTTVQQSFEFDPSSGTELQNWSSFSGLDSTLIHQIIDCPMVSVPKDISNGISLGIMMYPISARKEISDTYSLTHTVQIASNTEAILNSRLTMREILTEYRLTLINNQTMNKEVFTGIWRGNINLSSDLKITYNPL